MCLTNQIPNPVLFLFQGLGDNFYDAKQLLPENFKKVCEEVNYPLNLRMHEVSFVMGIVVIALVDVIAVVAALVVTGKNSCFAIVALLRLL